MIFKYLLLCLFGISTLFVTSSVARESIIGGDEASLHEFPYQVLLLVENKHVCGGGIIGEEFILTAAHCIMNEQHQFYSQMSVLAGTNNSNVRHEPAVVIEVAKYFYPIVFDRQTSHADIAILKLKHPLKLTTQGLIQKVKMPRNQSEDFAGKTAKIAGFGWNWIEVNATSRRGDNSDGKLRYAEVDVLKNRQCTFGTPPRETPEKQICARVKPRGSEHRGACSGDSGGLLVHGKMVIGILSNGSWGCAEEHSPAFYTRVSHFLTFIRNVKDGYITRNIREITLPNRGPPAQNVTQT